MCHCNCLEHVYEVGEKNLHTNEVILFFSFLNIFFSNILKETASVFSWKWGGGGCVRCSVPTKSDLLGLGCLTIEKKQTNYVQSIYDTEVLYIYLETVFYECVIALSLFSTTIGQPSGIKRHI